jgi:hypothetical protein
VPLTSLMINIMRRVQGTHGPTVRLWAHFLHLEWWSRVELTIGSGESWAVYKHVVSIQSNGNKVSYLPEFRIHRAVFPEPVEARQAQVDCLTLDMLILGTQAPTELVNNPKKETKESGLTSLKPCTFLLHLSGPMGLLLPCGSHGALNRAQMGVELDFKL